MLQPKKLGKTGLEPKELKSDRAGCRKFGPCGVGEKALYLNSFYFSRIYYLPLSSVRRIYKRVAMSRGGFTGKGMFATIPYLVVEYDDGQEKLGSEIIEFEKDKVKRLGKGGKKQ